MRTSARPTRTRPAWLVPGRRWPRGYVMPARGGRGTGRRERTTRRLANHVRANTPEDSRARRSSPKVPTPEVHPEAHRGPLPKLHDEDRMHADAETPLIPPRLTVLAERLDYFTEHDLML